MKKIDVAGIVFSDATLKQAAATALNFAKGDSLKTIATVNSEIAFLAIKDNKLRNTINCFDMVVPDGIGVIKASKILKTPLQERVAGFDLACSLIELFEQNNISLFLLGAGPGVAEKAVGNLKQKYKNLNICGYNDGYFTDEQKVIDKINQSGAKALFVCLGAPIQEYFIIHNRDKLKCSLAIGLGGTLDVLSGNAVRAPEFYIKHNLEWLYRIITMKRFKRAVRLPAYIINVFLIRLKIRGVN